MSKVLNYKGFGRDFAKVKCDCGEIIVCEGIKSYTTKCLCGITYNWYGEKVHKYDNS
jgi:hypothetical protein